jgi:hypothetical protein
LAIAGGGITPETAARDDDSLRGGGGGGGGAWRGKRFFTRSFARLARTSWLCVHEVVQA